MAIGLIIAFYLASPAAGLDFTVWRAILGLPIGVLVNGTFLFVLIKSPLLKKDRLSVLYLCGFILYIFSWLISVTTIDTGPILAVAFNFLFTVIHSVLLSSRFARAMQDVEEANTALEDKVLERTAELREANESLTASEHSVKEMVRNISHDLKTPMSVMSANLQMLEEDRPESEEFKRRLGVINSKMADLTRLIQNLTAVSRLESGETLYHMEWMHVSTLCTQLYRRYEAVAGQAGVSLRVNFARDCAVSIDPNEIWSVFENLINNALRYTPEGGVIRVTVNEPEAGFVTFAVSDNGCGMAPEHLSRIFERYYVADTARGGKSGSGIGLYIVRTAVEAMGGSVAAESAPGEGMKVRFQLKAAH
jgi:signal transduction histidine kinase